MVKLKCDQCGKDMEQDDLCRVGLLVSEKAQRAAEPTVAEVITGQRRARRKVAEEFDFCTECALALLVALKSRKAHIRKYGRVVRQ